MSQGNWNEVKKALKEFSREGLMSLLKDLYENSAENRAFLKARFAEDLSEAKENLDSYKKRIAKALKPQFDHEHDFAAPRFKLAEAKKAISEYRKASANPNGSLDLMLYYLEVGLGFIDKHSFLELGSTLPQSLRSVLEDFSAKLKVENDRFLYRRFSQRLQELSKIAGRCDIDRQFSECLEELAEKAQSATEELQTAEDEWS